MLWIKTADCTFFFQSYHCSLVITLRTCLSALWERSTTPTVCGCFTLACTSWISSSFVISCKSSEKNEFRRSKRIVFGKFLCRKKVHVGSCAIVSTLTFVKGKTNKYSLKTSVAVNTTVYCWLQWSNQINLKCLTRVRIQGRYWLNGVSKNFDGTRLSCKQIRQSLIGEMKKPVKIGKKKFFRLSSSVLAKPKCPAVFEIFRRKTTSRQSVFGTKKPLYLLYHSHHRINDIKHHFQQLGGWTVFGTFVKLTVIFATHQGYIDFSMNLPLGCLHHFFVLGLSQGVVFVSVNHSECLAINWS